MIVQQEVVSIEVDAGGGGLTAEFWAVFEENSFGCVEVAWNVWVADRVAAGALGLVVEKDRSVWVGGDCRGPSASPQDDTIFQGG